MFRRTEGRSRARVSGGWIVAAVAVFFALGGTAWAAHHYVISSTKQIKPSVLKQLHGAKGATGATGAQGPKGDQGIQGNPGNNGAVSAYSAGPANAVGLPLGSNTGNFATVVSKSLPAGHWVITGDVTVEGSTTAAPGTYTTVESTCEITAGGSFEGSAQTVGTLGENNFLVNFWSEETAVPVQTAITLSSPATIALECQVNLPTSGNQSGYTNLSVTAEGGTLEAIETNSIS